MFSFCFAVSSVCIASKHIIFLHNKFLETHDLKDAHPQYGNVELIEIKQKFKLAGFNVIASKRSAACLQEQVDIVIAQIDSILGENSQDTIKVVGTSKGGDILRRWFLLN